MQQQASGFRKHQSLCSSLLLRKHHSVHLSYYLDESALRTLEPTLVFPLLCWPLSPALAPAAVAIPPMTSGGGTGTGGPVGALPAATLLATAGKRTGTGCSASACGAVAVAGEAPPTGAGDGFSSSGAAGIGGPLCLGAAGPCAVLAPSPAPAPAGLSAPPSWWRMVRRRRGRNAGRAGKALWSLSQMLGGLPVAGAAAGAGSLSACITRTARHKLWSARRSAEWNAAFYSAENKEVVAYFSGDVKQFMSVLFD